MEAYKTCIQETKCTGDSSYNVIITKQFVLVVPRTASGTTIDGVHIEFNSLAFVGHLATKSEESLELITKTGPLKIL
jgi:ATP adenylyltransferase/5',5'''-P-1,P-4-tetraphosphate phosphorylase II